MSETPKQLIARLGFTYYESSLPQSLLCPICFELFADPVVSPTCSSTSPHIYCKACIEAWLKKKATCPLDRRPLQATQLRRADPKVQQSIDTLLIMCSLGCGWHGARKHWRGHLEDACPEFVVGGARRGSKHERELKDLLVQTEARWKADILARDKADAAAKAATIHKGIECTNCRTKSIRGIRYKCLACPRVDFCQLCYDDRDQVHPGHTFMRLDVPVAAADGGSASSYPCPSSDWNVQHWDVSCDGCGKADFAGPRHECTVCDSHNLCEECALDPAPYQYPGYSHHVWHPMIRHRVSVNPKPVIGDFANPGVSRSYL